MAYYAEKTVGSNGIPYLSLIHPEKGGNGDAQVFQVGEGKAGYQGHITIHADGNVNRHGIFDTPPMPDSLIPGSVNVLTQAWGLNANTLR